MTYTILLIFLLPVVIAEGDPQPNPEVVNRVAMSTQRLAVDILYDYVKNNPGEQYITSIPPLFAAIAMPGATATGMTSKKILNILNLKNKMEITNDFAPAFKQYLSNNTKSTITEFFGKVYGNEHKQFTSKFKKVVKSFNEKTGRGHFNDSEIAATEINAEIEQQGKLGFKPLVEAEDIENGGLLFVSTLELLAKFDQKLVPKPSRLNFKTGNTTMTLPAFTVLDNIPYAKIDEIEAQVYEFKQQGGPFSIVIFNPDTSDGLESMLNKMRKPKFVNQIIEQLEEKCIQATLPIINTRYRADNGASLQKFRYACDIFDSSNPKFEEVQTDSSTYIGSILHETSIKTMSIPAIMSKNVKCENYAKKVTFEHPFVFFLTPSSGPRAATIAGVFVGETD